MRIETIDGRRVAFGLDWVDIGDGLDVAIADQFDAEPADVKHLYVARSSRADTAGLVAAGGPIRKPPISAAQAVTRLNRDGLYAMALDDETLWFCGVQDGSVIAGTDSLEPASTGLQKVMALAAGLEIPVYFDPGMSQAPDAPQEGIETFDLRGYLQHVRIGKLHAYRRRNHLPLIAVAVVVLAGGGYLLFGAGQPKQQLTSAQQRAQRLQRYVTHVRQTVGAYPNDPTWATAALHEARSALPPFLSGWELSTVVCQPAECQAKYARVKDSTYAVAPFAKRFGNAMTVLKRGQSLKVVIPVHAAVMNLTSSRLRSVPSAAPALDAWLGDAPWARAGGSLSSAPLITNLAQRYHASVAGMPPLMFEQVAAGGRNYLGAVGLTALVRAGEVAGFRVVRFTWSPGFGKGGASWKVTWSRLHG